MAEDAGMILAEGEGWQWEQALQAPALIRIRSACLLPAKMQVLSKRSVSHLLAVCNMTASFSTWRTRARIFEIDSVGHVNNAVYWLYLQEATVAAWAASIPTLGEVSRLHLEYLGEARYGDDLEVLAWPEGSDAEGDALAGYAIRRLADGNIIVRARVAWRWLDAAGRLPQAAASTWPALSPPPGCAIKPPRLLPTSLDSRSFQWLHTVRSYEVERNGHASPVAILCWMEEAKFSAAAEVGWPPNRMMAADFVTVQLRHDTEFHTPLLAGDRIEVTSRICELRRVQGTWLHEVRRGGEIVARDYSSGAFLSREGRPRPAPEAMLAALMRAEDNSLIRR